MISCASSRNSWTRARKRLQVDVVERGLDLVHQVEGRGPAAEDGEEEGQRRHGALAAREQRDPAHVAPGRADLDLDAGVEQVVRARSATRRPVPPGNSMATSVEKCSLTSAAAAANDVMISWSSVRTTSCSSRRAPRTSSTWASSSLWRSSSVGELLEGQRVDRAERGQLALQLVGVLRQGRALGSLGLGQPGQVLGHGAQLAVHVLEQRLGAAGRPRWPRGRGCGCGCGPRRGAARSCGGPGGAARAARPPPGRRRPGPGSRDAGTRRCRRGAACSCSTNASRRASASPSASSRWRRVGRRGPLLGVALQPPLHLGLTLGQDPAALGRCRPRAPRAPGRRAPASARRSSEPPPGGRGPPRARAGTAASCACSAVTSDSRACASATAAAGLVELAGQAAPLLGGSGGVGPPGLAGRTVPVDGALGRRPGVAGPGPARSGPRSGWPAPARRRRRPRRPCAAPPRPPPR